MKKMLAILVLGLFAFGLFATASLTSADEGQGFKFDGLWEGVDVNDGSLRTVSISDVDQDGVFEVSAYDTYWSACGSDRAIFEGQGTIDDGVLRFTGTVTCVDTGLVLNIDVDYTPDAMSDVLIEAAVGLPFAPEVLHRVTKNSSLDKTHIW